MALDHYVSQVHLKNFYSPQLGRMYAIRKCDQKFFTPTAQAVCRIEDGSTNSYLREARVIEEFLKGIEPKYNGACEMLEARRIDPECIYVIAGFVSYVLACSPAGMRIHSNPLKAMVEETSRVLESHGSIPPPPSELGGESLTELLNSGKLRVEIDPKYPQAVSIASILSHVRAFGNFTWDILLNPFDDSPFFTSDYPVAIERSRDPRFLNRVVPISPNLAIRIRPDISYQHEHDDYSFSKFRYIVRTLSRKEVIKINTLIVRCAESVVFFRDNHQWISRFVKNNANFRIIPKTQKIPYRDGSLVWCTQVCVPH